MTLGPLSCLCISGDTATVTASSTVFSSVTEITESMCVVSVHQYVNPVFCVAPQGSVRLISTKQIEIEEEIIASEYVYFFTTQLLCATYLYSET